MKTSIIIFFLLLQALFISASAMNEIPAQTDSSQVGTSLVVLLNGNEIFGEIISQTDDSVNIKTANNLLVKLSIKQLSCIIHFEDNYNPNIENESNKNYMFYMLDKSIKYGRIISDEGSYYRIMFNKDTITTIDRFDFLYKFPSYVLKSINWLNGSTANYSRVFLENEGSLDGQLFSEKSENIKLIIQDKFLIKIPVEYINGYVVLNKISDSSAIGKPTHRIILKNEHEITGHIISKSKDSIIMKVEPGVSAQISNNDIDNIYDYNYYTKNIIYLDGGSVLLSSYINISYERLLYNIFSMRVSYGYGYLIHSIADGPTTNGETLSILLNLLLFEGNSKFEFGFGAGYFKENKVLGPTSKEFVYAFSIGYRYQPKYGGIIFRSGISLFYPGFGLNLSLGYTF